LHLNNIWPTVTYASALDCVPGPRACRCWSQQPVAASRCVSCAEEGDGWSRGWRAAEAAVREEGSRVENNLFAKKSRQMYLAIGCRSCVQSLKICTQVLVFFTWCIFQSRAFSKSTLPHASHFQNNPPTSPGYFQIDPHTSIVSGLHNICSAHNKKDPEHAWAA
jgi:hypothetical protein